MSNQTTIELRTLQQYKEYAESTQQLNQALNNEIKHCYRQIDSLRQQLRNRSNSTVDTARAADYQKRIIELEQRNKQQASDVGNLRNTITKIENELRAEQQLGGQKARQITKQEEEIARYRKEVIEQERKFQNLETKLKISEGENTRQGVLLRELQQSNVMNLVESRRRESVNISNGGTNIIGANTGIAEQKIKNLEGELKRCHEDNNWLKQMVADKAALEELLMKQVATVTNQRIAAEKIAKEAQGEVTKLKNQTNEIRSCLSNYQKQLDETKNKLINSERKFQILQQQHKNGINNDHFNYESKLSELTAQLESRNQIIRQLQKHLQALEVKASKLQAQTSLPPVGEQLQLAANQISSLRKDNALLKVENDNLQKELTQLKITIDNQSENSLKKSQSRTKSSNFSSLKSDNVGRLKSDYADALKKINQLIEQNAKLQIARNELLGQIQKLRGSQLQIEPYQSRFATQYKQNTVSFSNSVPSLKLSTSNKDLHEKRLWKRESANPPQDYHNKISTVSYQTWMTLQRKIDTLRNQNDILRKDLSFGAFRV